MHGGNARVKVEGEQLSASGSFIARETMLYSDVLSLSPWKGARAMGPPLALSMHSIVIAIVIVGALDRYSYSYSCSTR